MALGAKAVLIGRPYAYALAINGEKGVEELMLNLSADTELTLGLAGKISWKDTNPDCLTRASPHSQ
jgi:lactate 2-monooxygenase